MSAQFSCFISGTDTGVGKTLISAAFLHALGRAGVKAVGMKPVAAGTEIRDGQPWNEDVALLAQESSLHLPRELTTSYLLNEPCAPHVAAKLQDVSIDPGTLKRAYQQVASIVYREQPYLTLAHGKRTQPIRREVQNFRIDPLTRTILHEVSVK